MKLGKKILSTVMALAITSSLVTVPSVYADYYGHVQSFTGATIDASKNLPTGWSNINGSRSSEIVGGMYGKSANNNSYKMTSTATSGPWGVPPVYPNRVLANLKSDGSFNQTETLIDGSYYHLTTEVAACDEDFYHLGLYAHRVKVKYTPKGGSATNSGELVAGDVIFGFCQEERGNVRLKAWGEDITPEGFEFKTKTWYKLDVIFNGITNTMDTYLNGEFIKTVDFADNIAAAAVYNDKEAYDGWYIYLLKYIGVVFDRYKETGAGSSVMYDNVGFGNYYYGAAKPVIAAPESNLSVNGNPVTGETVSLPEGLTVGDAKDRIMSSNMVVIVDANGQAKENSATIAEGDRIVEVMANETVFKYYNIGSASGKLIGNKLTFSDYAPTPAANAPDELASIDLPMSSDGVNAFNKWSFNTFFLYAPTGKFGKADTDKCLHIWNVNTITTGSGSFNRTGNFLWSPAEVSMANQNIHISAEIAADNVDFTELGLWNRFDNNISIDDPFCFAKNGDKIDIKSFGDVVVSDFDFRINQFYKVDLVYLGNSKKMDLWLDGSLLANIDFSSKLAEGYNLSKIKYLFLDSDYSQSNGALGNTYYDNLYIETFSNGAYPEIASTRGSSKLFSDNLTVENGRIYVAPMAKASDVLENVTSNNTIKLFAKDFSDELTGDESIETLSVLVEYAQDGETMHYSYVYLPAEIASIEEELINDGKQTRFTANGNFVNSGSEYAGRYMMAIATYEGENKLHNVAVGYITLTEDYGTTMPREWYVDVDTEDMPENLTVKAFIWKDGEEPIVPFKVY